MDYKVLYRKYRPKDFSNIIGQDYMVSILKNSINNHKISHAYIFSGPRGTGKTSTAKVFARAINCLNPNENGPCNECEVCTNIENTDIIEIDAASNNGVDEIRELINNIKLAPAYSKYKVYIIDEVHMLSASAFNALLLTLEEPPKNVVFILATTNIEAVRKISKEAIVERLKVITGIEKIAIEDEALAEIALISDGGMRDALSILDQLSGSQNKITINDVISHFGSVSQKQINDLYTYILNNNVDNYLDMMQKFKNLAIDYKILIKKLLEKIETEAIASKKNNNYQGFDYQILKEMAFELAKISNYVNINIDPYMLIEITLLKYFNNNENKPLKEEPKNEIKEEKKEDKPKEIPIPPKTNLKNTEEINELIKIRINNCFVNAKKEYLQTVKNNWSEFIGTIKNNTILNLLIDSTIVAASDNIIILTNQIEGTVKLINENLDSIADLYNDKFSNNYKFIALTNSNWELERQKYINNLKNKIAYTLIEEPPKNTTSKVKEKTSPIEEIANDIFQNTKIEIE